MTRKQNNLGVRHWNGEDITEKPNEYTTWKMNYIESKKAQRRIDILIHSKRHSKKYEIRKRQSMMDNGSKDSLSPVTDWISK